MGGSRCWPKSARLKHTGALFWSPKFKVSIKKPAVTSPSPDCAFSGNVPLIAAFIWSVCHQNAFSALAANKWINFHVIAF